MTFEEFRSSEVLTTWLRALLDSPNMKLTMEALAQGGPEHMGVASTVTPQYANVLLGMSRGYAMYPDMLKLLTEPVKTGDDLESNYKTEDE